MNELFANKYKAKGLTNINYKTRDKQIKTTVERVTVQ